jgi:pre-mRNA-splicing factor ATP-dependent RNA helicase DHX16
MMTDPSLEHYGTIIVDEAHERSTSTDILLPLIKDIAKYRPEFRVIISSATMDAQKWSKYFNDCPIFSVPGRAFPIEIYHTESPEANYLSAAVTTVFQIHLTQPLGDILVFLTGEDEIVSVQENLEETCRKLQGRCPEMIICPLYAALPSDLQSKVFEPTPPRARKVVLATNIAETSLTIDNIIYVVDSGFVKENVYSPQTGIESLVVTPCSQASANQRAGRAGRTNPGKAFRLYTRYSYYNELPASPTPELLRCDLTPIVLLLKGLGLNDLVNFDFLDGPPADTLIRSLETLYALGAIDDKGAITRTGRKMAEIPLAPSAGAAMLASDRYKCSEEVLSIVAKLHADAAHRRFCDREGGDHLTLLRIWREWCDSDFSPIWAKENFLQQRTLTRVRDVRDQLQTLADRVEIEHSSAGDDAIAIKKAMTTGYFPNAARLNRSGDSYRCLKNGMTVFIHPSSVIQEDKPKWVLYDSLTTTSKEYMRNILPIDSQWLLDAAPHMYKPEDLEKLGVDKKMPKARKPQ